MCDNILISCISAHHHCKTKLGYTQKWGFDKMAKNKLLAGTSFAAFSSDIVTCYNSDQLQVIVVYTQSTKILTLGTSFVF